MMKSKLCTHKMVGFIRFTVSLYSKAATLQFPPQCGSGLVVRCGSHFVGQGNECSMFNQHLSGGNRNKTTKFCRRRLLNVATSNHDNQSNIYLTYSNIIPECSIVERRIPVFIAKICLRTSSEQLQISWKMSTVARQGLSWQTRRTTSSTQLRNNHCCYQSH